MKQRTLGFLLGAAVSTFAATTAAATPATALLPAASAPPGFVAADDPKGGRVVYGQLGSGASADAAFRDGLRVANRYFGGTLTLDSALRSTQGAVPSVSGWFRATLHGTNVAGLAVAAVDPRGGPRLTLLFDREGAFPRTLPHLAADLSGAASGTASDGTPPSTPNGTVPPLHRVSAADNSVAIAIPSSWQVKTLQHGAYSVAGPDGARVDGFPIAVASPGDRYLIGMPHAAYVADPGRAFAIVRRAMARAGDPDPDVRIEKSTPLPAMSTATIQAASVAGTVVAPDGKRRFAALMSTVAPTQPGGPWQLNLAVFLSAPADRYAGDLRAMKAIAGTVAINGRVVAQQNKQISDMIGDTSRQIVNSGIAFRGRQQAIFEQSMASARQAQDSIDRSTAGFVHYLSDQSVVNVASLHGHATVGNAIAQTMVNAQPNEFSIVPLNQYRKGVDY